ncbi:hypothetical protein R1A27_09520 [Methylobacterium sp. NMS12]|uniref:hypothetical protein n=1 Tax=Methylobacterium sp. NMS12 TaxID=3079766 RepID=UPI003F882EFD
MHRIDLAPTDRASLRLAQMRRRAKRLGLKLSRSRWHQSYVQNRGGLILADTRGEIIAGDGYCLDLASVDRILSSMADQMSPAMPRSVGRLRRGETAMFGADHAAEEQIL